MKDPEMVGDARKKGGRVNWDWTVKQINKIIIINYKL